MNVRTEKLLPILNKIFPGVWLYGAALKVIGDLKFQPSVRAQQEQVIFAHLHEVTRRTMLQESMNFALAQDEAAKFLQACEITPMKHGMIYQYLLYSRMMSFRFPEYQLAFQDMMDLVLGRVEGDQGGPTCG